jgi:protein-S-isoprenylcysteine O-methyltransferase Ste14
MSNALSLGLGASALWIAILLWSDRQPHRRLWPPLRGTWITALWAWGLTVLIYVGLIRACTADWNPLDLPVWLRWGLGAGLSTVGSVIQTQGMIALGLRGTSGWSKTLVTTGVQARWRHPQYLGQIMTLVGIALFAGTIWGWLVVAAGSAALVYAARVEDRFLAQRYPEHAAYAARVGWVPFRKNARP